MMNPNKLKKYFDNLCKQQSDINEHLETLVKYGEVCDHITEMGVRSCVSTWSFLVARPNTIVSYDIQNPPSANIKSVKDTAKDIGVDFSFIKASTIDIEIEYTDLLFIDTHHSYAQLQKELALHSSKANKYIIMHDTVLFGRVDQYNSPPSEKQGLYTALEEFLDLNKNWQIKEHYTNNNGLTIMERVNNE